MFIKFPSIRGHLVKEEPPKGMRCSGEVFQLLAGVSTVTVQHGNISGLGVLILQAEGPKFHTQQHIVRALLFSVLGMLL